MFLWKSSRGISIVCLTSNHSTLAVRHVGFQHLAMTVSSRLLTHSISTTALALIRCAPVGLVPLVLQYCPGHNVTLSPVGGLTGCPSSSPWAYLGKVHRRYPVLSSTMSLMCKCLSFSSRRSMIRDVSGSTSFIDLLSYPDDDATPPLHRYMLCFDSHSSVLRSQWDLPLDGSIAFFLF